MTQPKLEITTAWNRHHGEMKFLLDKFYAEMPGLDPRELPPLADNPAQLEAVLEETLLMGPWSIKERCFLATLDGTPAGFYVAQDHGKDFTFVPEEFRGHGTGRGLIEAKTTFDKAALFGRVTHHDRYAEPEKQAHVTAYLPRANESIKRLFKRVEYGLHKDGGYDRHSQIWVKDVSNDLNTPSPLSKVA